MNIWALLGFMVGCELIGAAQAWATFPNLKDWYVTLKKPWYTPPSWAFGPVWITLYALMGIAGYLIWFHTPQSSLLPYAKAAFIAQLVFNFAWSFLFFAFKQLKWALVDVLLLWLSIAATVVLVAPLSVASAWLLLPYLLWVSIASCLNNDIIVLNPKTPPLQSKNA